ncbi:MAG: DUF4830 domain-containing protein [Clostridia bacterium]|nr:DUF4830 domain-containing protein [Clostridia bacterium]
MFVYSVKANTLKLVGIIGAALLILIVMIFLIPDYAPKTTAAIAKQNEDIKYDKIKDNDDRIAFLGQFGWEVDPDPTEEVTIRIPSEFDRVLTSYNELQKQQGLDLSRYRGKEVTRYSYKVKNYPEYNGDVTANVIVFKNRVIGGDICSSDVSGFIGTFEFPDKSFPEESDAPIPAKTEATAPETGDQISPTP